MDLVFAIGFYRALQTPPFAKYNTTGVITLGANRILVSHILVSLHKVVELYERYRSVMPPEAANEMRVLRRELKARGVSEFRHKVVGHIWDSNRKRPLTAREVDDALDRVTKGSAEGLLDRFLSWIANIEYPQRPNTVAGILNSTKDAIMREHRILAEELRT